MWFQEEGKLGSYLADIYNVTDVDLCFFWML